MQLGLFVIRSEPILVNMRGALGLTLCLAGLAGCLESTDGLGSLGPGPLSEDELIYQVFKVDGSPAAGALIYGIDRTQGRLLTRANDVGRFGLRTPVERLVARQGFGEVNMVDTVDLQDGQIFLEPTEGRRATQHLRGIGMEEIFIPRVSEILSLKAEDGDVFASGWNEPLSMLQVVALDGLEVVVNVGRSSWPNKPSSNIAFSGEYAVVEVRYGPFGGESQGQLFVFDRQSRDQVWQTEFDTAEMIWAINDKMLDVVFRESDATGLERIIVNLEALQETRTSFAPYPNEFFLDGAFVGRDFYFCRDGRQYRHQPGAPRADSLAVPAEGNCDRNTYIVNEDHRWVFLRGGNIEVYGNLGERRTIIPLPPGPAVRSLYVDRVAGTQDGVLIEIESRDEEELYIFANTTLGTAVDLTTTAADAGFVITAMQLELHQNGGQFASLAYTPEGLVALEWSDTGSDHTYRVLNSLPDQNLCRPLIGTERDPNASFAWGSCYDGVPGSSTLHETADGTRRSFIGQVGLSQADGRRIFYANTVLGAPTISTVSLDDLR